MWNIVFYIDHRGKCPPLEFINKLPVMDQAKNSKRFTIITGVWSEFTFTTCKTDKRKTLGTETWRNPSFLFCVY